MLGALIAPSRNFNSVLQLPPAFAEALVTPVEGFSRGMAPHSPRLVGFLRVEQQPFLPCAEGVRARPPGHHRCFPVRRAVFSRFNKLRKAEAGDGRHHGPSRQPARLGGAGRGFLSRPCAPGRNFCPHESQMPKRTHTRSSPRQAHPALHTLGRMRPHLKATQERQQYEAALPPAPPSPVLSGQGAQPTPQPAPRPQPGPYCRYSLSSLLPALSGKVRYEELVFLTRGSRALGSMAVPWPVPVVVRVPLRSGPDAGGCLGDGEEEAAESERGEAARRCLIREISASWACAWLASGEETGGAGKPAGKEPRGNDGALQPSSCARPALAPPRPH